MDQLKLDGELSVVVYASDESARGKQLSASELKDNAVRAQRRLDALTAPDDGQVRDYPYLAARQVTVRSVDRLLELANSDSVTKIQLPLTAEPTLVQSMPIVRQPLANANGADGSGQIVAVMDQGNHGTNVMAIAQAAAPQADVRLYELGIDAMGFLTGIEAEFNQVLADRAAGDNIRSLNLSFGAASGACLSNFDASLQAVQAAGIVTVASAGNNGILNVASPACRPWALAVGAVYDADIGPRTWTACADATTSADQIACFSQTGPTLDILAPGSRIFAGGFTMSGTSMAAPHVAGAIAALASVRPGASTAQLRAAVLSSQERITDSRNGLTYPRLDIETARMALVAATAGDGGVDFDGDGFDDIFWYAAGGASDWVNYGTGTSGTFTSISATVSGAYIPISGDFDGDGYGDVFWYGPGTAPDYVNYGSAVRGVFDSRSVTISGNYVPVSGDFNGDGFDDVFWYGPGAGADELSSGTATRGSFTATSPNVSGTYIPISGDFNGDGFGDIYWYAPGTAADYLNYGTSTEGIFTQVSVSAVGTYIPISGDFDGDGFGDIYWYAPGAAQDWANYGTASPGIFNSFQVSANGTYVPMAGDFNGDGFDDIFWYGPGSDADELIDGTAVQGTFTPRSANVNGVYTPIG